MFCPSPREFKGRVIRCGKCKTCLAHSASVKRWVVKTRIVAEIGAAQRTWFVTLTLRKNMSDQLGYRLVQRWLKRLRKASSDPIRYACVAEHGSKTGRLHYHVVLHGPISLTERTVRSKWRGGISQATLVGSTDARNVALYSSKVASYTAKGGRFRFSQGYGSRPIKRMMTNDIVQAVLAEWPKARIRIGGQLVPDRLQGPRPTGVSSRWSDDLKRDAHETYVAMKKGEQGKRRLPLPYKT